MKNKTWIDSQREKVEISLKKDLEKIIFTAQPGGLLDRIWKGKFRKER